MRANDPFLEGNEPSTRSEIECRLMYSMAVVRAINGLVDTGQQGVYADSVASIANRMDLPSWLVELRHDSTHNALPSISVLQAASSLLLSWYYTNYWQKQHMYILYLNCFCSIICSTEKSNLDRCKQLHMLLSNGVEQYWETMGALGSIESNSDPLPTAGNSTSKSPTGYLQKQLYHTERSLLKDIYRHIHQQNILSVTFLTDIFLPVFIRECINAENPLSGSNTEMSHPDDQGKLKVSEVNTKSIIPSPLWSIVFLHTFNANFSIPSTPSFNDFEALSSRCQSPTQSLSNSDSSSNLVDSNSSGNSNINFKQFHLVIVMSSWSQVVSCIRTRVCGGELNDSSYCHSLLVLERVETVCKDIARIGASQSTRSVLRAEWVSVITSEFSQMIDLLTAQETMSTTPITLELNQRIITKLKHLYALILTEFVESVDDEVIVNRENGEIPNKRRKCDESNTVINSCFDAITMHRHGTVLTSYALSPFGCKSGILNSNAGRLNENMIQNTHANTLLCVELIQ